MPIPHWLSQGDDDAQQSQYSGSRRNKGSRLDIIVYGRQKRLQGLRRGVRQIIEPLNPEDISDAERLGRPGLEDLNRGQPRREDYGPARHRQWLPTSQQVPPTSVIGRPVNRQGFDGAQIEGI